MVLIVLDVKSQDQVMLKTAFTAIYETQPA